MIAYKCLCTGGIGPFSRYAWPLPRDGRPGAWVVGPGGAAMCRGGMHACRPPDLPWWLQDELWEVELDGDVRAGRHKVVAPRARLVRRVDAWDAACAQRFAEACALRARDHAADALERAGARGLAAELRASTTLRAIRAAARSGDVPAAARIAVTMAVDAAGGALAGGPVVTGYIAAHAAARATGPAGMAAERARQGEWLREALSLRG
jgi:hypothetical protein